MPSITSIGKTHTFQQTVTDKIETMTTISAGGGEYEAEDIPRPDTTSNSKNKVYGKQKNNKSGTKRAATSSKSTPGKKSRTSTAMIVTPHPKKKATVEKETEQSKESSESEKKDETAEDSPRQIWEQNKANDKEKKTVSKKEVRNYVAESIFPHLKFIEKPEVELAWSENEQTICQLCLRGFNLTLEKEDLKSYWESDVRKMVDKELSKLRNTKTNSMKRDYLGTLTRLDQCNHAISY